MSLKKDIALAAVAALVFAMAFTWAWVRDGVDVVRAGMTATPGSTALIHIEGLDPSVSEGVDLELIASESSGGLDGLLEDRFDVVLYELETLLDDLESMETTQDLAFYGPLFTSRPTAIFVSGERNYSLYAERRGDEDALREVMSQLSGATLALVTPWSVSESYIRQLFARASIADTDYTLVDTITIDGLAGLKSGEFDALVLSGTEDIDSGHQEEGVEELIRVSDVFIPRLYGWLSKSEYVCENRDLMKHLTNLFFRAGQFLEGKKIRREPTMQEYKRRFGDGGPDDPTYNYIGQEFPREHLSAAELFYHPDSPYYWKAVLDRIRLSRGIESGAQTGPEFVTDAFAKDWYRRCPVSVAE